MKLHLLPLPAMEKKKQLRWLVTPSAVEKLSVTGKAIGDSATGDFLCSPSVGECKDCNAFLFSLVPNAVAKTPGVQSWPLSAQ